MLVPLVTTPYISRVLGAEKIGEFSFTYSIAAYFAYFAALGTTVYARRGIAYLQEERCQRTIFFWEIISLRFLLTAVFLSGYFILLCNYGLSRVALAQCFYIVAVAFDIVWLFQGMENFTKIVFRNIVVKILGVAFIFLLVKTKDDLLLYVLINGILPLFGSLFFWVDIKKYVGCFPSIKQMKPFQHVKGAFWLFIPTIASQVYLLLDKTMIGLFSVDSVENGFYEQSQKVVKICWTVVTTFAVVMSPRIAAIFAKKEVETLRKYMRDSFRFVWFLSVPIAFGLFAITDNLVPWFFGAEFLPVKKLLYVFSVIVLPVGISAVTGGQYLVATKRQNIFSISIVLAAVLNFAMNFVLIPKYFAFGAAISSVAAELFAATVQIVYITIVTKDFSFLDVFSGFVKYLMAGSVMFIAVWRVGLLLTPSLLHTLCLVAIGVAVYALLLLASKDYYAILFFRKMQSLLKRT